jgi:excinuclease ABC subunit C
LIWRKNKHYDTTVGDKKQILDLSIRNAKFYRTVETIADRDPDRHANRIMAQMQI